MTDLFSKFFTFIAKFLYGVVQLQQKVYHFLEMVGYVVGLLNGAFSYLPGWFIALGTLTLVTAIVWIVIEII